MRSVLKSLSLSAALTAVGGLALLPSFSAARAEDPAPSGDTKVSIPEEKGVTTYDLFDAAKKGLVTVSAEGIGDGRMTLSVHNRTKKQLRVVLPPGLIASGASGQFGGWAWAAAWAVAWAAWAAVWAAWAAAWAAWAAAWAAWAAAWAAWAAAAWAAWAAVAA